MTKLDPTGSRLVYSTLLGGEDDDEAFDIAIDSAGMAYVAGTTERRSGGGGDFPIKNAFQPSVKDDGNAFVTKLNRGGDGS